MEDIEEAKEEVIPFKGIPDVIERYYSQFFLLSNQIHQISFKPPAIHHHSFCHLILCSFFLP